MEREEETWLEECEEPDKKRRRGHEKDSQYDKLMAKWCAIWNKMLQKHWQYMVDTGEEQLELVPDEFKDQIKIPRPHYEYDGAKLERVVQAAMERAREAGKHDLAAAVEQVYLDALQDTKLRVLLEAILTQKASRQQNEEFQGFVKLAKAKIREQKQKQDELNAAAAGGGGGAGGAPNGTAHTRSDLMPVPHARGPIHHPQQHPHPHQAPAPAPTQTSAPVVAPTPIPPPTPAHIQAPIQAPLPTQTPAPLPTPAPTQAPAAAVAKVASSVNATPAPSGTAGTVPTASTPVQPNSATKSIKTTPKSKTASKTKLPGQPKIISNGQAKSQAQAAIQNNVNGVAAAQSTPSTTVQSTSSAKGQPNASASASAPSQPKFTQDNNVHSRVTAILGDLQHTVTAQQILRAAPDIDDSRLLALKSTLINHPETKTDFKALAARLEKETSVGPEAQAVAGASRPVRTTAGKRRRTSVAASAMAAAEENDLLEAQRAAKRRRGEAGEDDGGDYHPLKAVRDKSRKKKKSGARPGNSQSGENSNSRDTSPLSDLSEMDIESTKSAYVDELVRRRTVEQARNDIVERYGPVSPTDAGDADEDWASMASPTLGPMQIEDGTNQLTERVPSPPPEPAPAENDALRLISGAAAQAVAKDPGIGRLEAKLDTLITASGSRSTIHAQTANEMNVANTETLKEIATVLSTADLATTRPEFVRLVLQLTTNAAEAAIHSAEAAKKAGEMARDVSLILQSLGVKGAAPAPAGGAAAVVGGGGGEHHPNTPLSEN